MITFVCVKIDVQPHQKATMNISKFIALDPAPMVRYSLSAFNAYGTLFEHNDTHGTAVWLCSEGVMFDEEIISFNVFTGKRTAPRFASQHGDEA